MVDGKSVFICNGFHAKLVDSIKNRALWMSTRI